MGSESQWQFSTLPTRNLAMEARPTVNRVPPKVVFGFLTRLNHLDDLKPAT